MSRAAVVMNPTKLDDDEAFRKSVRQIMDDHGWDEPLRDLGGPSLGRPADADDRQRRWRPAPPDAGQRTDRRQRGLAARPAHGGIYRVQFMELQGTLDQEQPWELDGEVMSSSQDRASSAIPTRFGDFVAVIIDAVRMRTTA